MGQPCFGPCGREVEVVNSDGLCAKCQQARAAERGAGSSEGPRVKRQYRRRTAPGGTPGERLCKRGCGRAVHKGRCKRASEDVAKPRRAYTRRVGPEKASGGAFERLTTLRAGIQEEYDLAEHALAVLRVKLETYDEILGGFG